MTMLHRLFDEQGQSPWLDNLTRGHLTDGELERLIRQGIRGVTSNPTIFAKAISGSNHYDDQFRRLSDGGVTVTDAYWTMVVDDIKEALVLLREVYNESGGGDGFVSVELAPDLAHDAVGSVNAARELHDRIDEPNLFVKIPATPEGIPAIRRMVGEGRNINVTLIFSLERYEEVIEAYLAGLEVHHGDLSSVHGVASFFVSRVDTEIDRRLDAIGTDEAQAWRGKAAVAQARLAYRLFQRAFSGPRWEGLKARGAQPQRPLWASTSTKDPAYSDTLYVDQLIGPDTINTMPESTIAMFEDHGSIARTIDGGVAEAEQVLEHLKALGVDMVDVGRTLEQEGVTTFEKSFSELLESLGSKQRDLVS